MSTQTRKPQSKRREEIVQAVLRVIGERGVTALTTATLAAEVGVTTGALFRHFPNIEAILKSAVDYALIRIEETFPDAQLPPLERLIQLGRNRVSLMGGNPGLAWLLRSEQALLVLPAESAKALRMLVKRSRRFMLAAILEGGEQGQIRADIDPEVLLVPIMGTIHALIGMPGPHKRRKLPDTERLLSALMLIVAPVT